MNDQTWWPRAAAFALTALMLLAPAAVCCLAAELAGEAFAQAEAAVEFDILELPHPTTEAPPQQEDEATQTQPATTSAAEPLYYIPDIPLPRELQAYTYALCVEAGVSYELTLAVMQRESRFEPDARGTNRNGSHDSGLMQINSCNAAWLKEEHGIDDLMDPLQNIRAGVLILSGHVSRYGENDGLMAYNMGAAGARSAKSRGVTSTAYSRGVLKARDVIARMPKAA